MFHGVVFALGGDVGRASGRLVPGAPRAGHGTRPGRKHWSGRGISRLLLSERAVLRNRAHAAVVAFQRGLL
jgi:hypothetical protein